MTYSETQTLINALLIAFISSCTMFGTIMGVLYLFGKLSERV